MYGAHKNKINKRFEERKKNMKHSILLILFAGCLFAQNGSGTDKTVYSRVEIEREVAMYNAECDNLQKRCDSLKAAYRRLQRVFVVDTIVEITPFNLLRRDKMVDEPRNSSNKE